MSPGSGARLRASIATYSARVPSRCQSASPSTRCPSETPVVPYPRALTTPASSCPGVDGVRSRPRRSVHVEGQAISVGTNPDAWTRTMTSLIAAGGSGRSTSVIPANPAASSVTTIAFILHLAVSRMRLHRTLDSPTPQPSHGTPGEPARTLLLCAVEQAGPRQALPSARLLPSPNGLDRPGSHREAARSDAPEEPDRSG